ncbi:MAG: hypothetical protein ICV54_14575 [Nostoc sp. C3-bin3]|nr:hypothetical protein [Nostoc sp. C3-bin3]
MKRRDFIALVAASAGSTYLRGSVILVQKDVAVKSAIAVAVRAVESFD